MLDATTQEKAGYGLGLISHAQIRPGSMSQYVYDASAGKGTYAYVVGSGINVDHKGFEKRASCGYNAFHPEDKDFEDEYGQGTAVAGVIGSKEYGVAKQTNLIAVKVLHRTRGSLSLILEGYQWAVRDLRKQKRMHNGLIAVTIYGPSSKAFDRAVNVAAGRGVTTIACAGDLGKDARMSPGAPTAIAVSATNDMRRKPAWANWGDDHVDIFAPGVKIRSTGIRSSTAVLTISGTSVAAAYVAGIVLYFKGLSGSSLDDAFAVKKFLLKHSLSNTAELKNGKTAPFAYNGSGE